MGFCMGFYMVFCLTILPFIAAGLALWLGLSPGWSILIAAIALVVEIGVLAFTLREKKGNSEQDVKSK